MLIERDQAIDNLDYHVGIGVVNEGRSVVLDPRTAVLNVSDNAL